MKYTPEKITPTKVPWHDGMGPTRPTMAQDPLN